MSTNLALDSSKADDDTGPDFIKISFSLIICILGLFGNLMASFIILVLKEHQKSITHWYVLQLAVADSLFLLTLPFKVSEDLNDEWIYSEWMCKAKETVLFLNYYASVQFLVVMSVDRYIAVCHTFSDVIQKLRRGTAAFVIALIVWSVALLLCIPAMLYSFKTGVSPTCKCSFEFPDVTNTTAQCLNDGYTVENLTECLEDSNLEARKENKHCKSLNDDDISVLLSLYNYYYGELDDVNDLTSNVDESGNGNPSNHLEMPMENKSESDGNSESDDKSESDDDSESTYASCNYGHKPIGWFAFIGFNFAGMFLLPLIIMVVCYGLIVYRISERRVEATNSSRSASISHTSTGSTGSQKRRKKSVSRSDKDRRRVTIMCAALVGSFVACWLPFHAIHLAKMHGIKSVNKNFCKKLSTAGSLLAYLNSALNPYLYSLLGTNFLRRWNKTNKDTKVLKLLFYYFTILSSSVTSTLRQSFRRRRSSSSGVGSVRYTRKRAGREGSTSNTATVVTKVFRSGNDKSVAASNAMQSPEVTALNSEAQHLNAIASTSAMDPNEKGFPPPDDEQSLCLDLDKELEVKTD